MRKYNNRQMCDRENPKIGIFCCSIYFLHNNLNLLVIINTGSYQNLER